METKCDKNDICSICQDTIDALLSAITRVLLNMGKSELNSKKNPC
jgi:hypothetical protein